MAQTVAQCLKAAEDSVTLINDVNTNGKKSIYVGGSAEADTSWTQDQINERVQQNVDHLETILTYEPVDSDDTTPNIVGSSSSKKTDCTNAVNTGKAYIAANK